MKKDNRQKGFILLCILPTLIIFSIFIVYPVTQVFFKSLFSSSGFGSGDEYVGFANFIELFKDDVFLKSLKNTGFLMLVVPVITLLLSLIFASMLSFGELKEKHLYRTIFFFPSILSFVVIGILWAFIYHPNMGIVNEIMTAIGLDQFALTWLGNKNTVLWAIALVMVWQAVGYYMVMYLAGMDSIPKELYEAASIDGATGFQQFIKITIPMLWEIIRITIIFSINGVLNISFVLVTVMTSGGPNNSSQVALTYMYQQAFVNANFGYAMAIAVVVFVIAIILAFISNKLTEQETE
ncbi:N-acetylglucosamine transport system permease protein [Virgibacillus halotolerans]|uniref:carbohydrate ABC transporter permease n=1 Tax=Virgibacillus halotolerans TaxID=1071053 RepID=UPI001961861D|nr:sugar ABC transporter permease [Virgibacillus halotolerans]MBM7600025.1 N-acetylglucosamine transport system permease protein [Virgibacillus halotolerans]